MPLTITEEQKSRAMSEQLREGRLERTVKTIWTIRGADDPGSTAVTDLGPQPSEVYGDGSLGLVLINREYEILIATGASGAIRLVATYGPPERLPGNNNPDEPEYEISTMAETVKVEKAIAQRHFPSSENTVGLAIGVNEDKIDGVDVYFPKGTYTQTKERQSLTGKYLRTLQLLSGTINKSAWKFWEASEVLFLGATARRKGVGAWKLNYSFVIQPNVTDTIDTAGGPQIVAKPGWDYQWFERKKTSNADKSKVVHSVKAVHVAQVYPLTDFGLLGLGS